MGARGAAAQEEPAAIRNGAETHRPGSVRYRAGWHVEEKRLLTKLPWWLQEVGK